MPRRWSRGTDRTLSDGLDSDYDRAKQVASAHRRNDADRSSQRSTGKTSGPSCDSASTPKKRGWFS
ncbi:hypothetical protein GCM10010277_44120 [Streptomyces longisporoflavus]|nr:hypothetical protein GCM10010277_44120 [Streptomyces longisporoflavus]